jgi:uncharacterized protein YgiM (DUF1202 family)
MLLLLALVAGLYAMSATAKGDGDPKPTQTAQPTAQPSQTAQPGTCEIHTGVDNGTVNLRQCAGTSCAVVTVLSEGESLTILTAGLWANVTTVDGVTGWLKSTYCKGH